MPRITILIVMLAMLSGCGRWAIERYDAETSERIDSQLRTGMSLSDFRTAFPDAKAMGTDTWLVTVQEDCFWCNSGHGFRESHQVFARTVTFANGTLASIDPLPGVKP